MPKRKRTIPKGDAPASVAVDPAVVASSLLEETRTLRRSSRIKKTERLALIEVSLDDPEKEDSPLTVSGEDDKLQVKSPKESPNKRKRRKKDVEPIVYDIPPVERKYTNFKGRLGYACLNTVLRAQKPEPVFCSRTCRMDTIHKNGLDFAKNLGLQNCQDLYKLVEWNEENDIRFLRVSSEMFPFASHKELGYDLEYARDELKRVGDLAKRLGHRLTTHPGQFTQLASPRENVVEASVRELEYHCQMLRYMGLDQHSVIIIHMGGVYGDKESTLQRFKENYTTKLNDEMKARLVLENDEMCYNPDELLPICNELNIPIVFDYHHNWINPSVHPLSALIPMINATWLRKGIKPKQHLSSPRPGCESGSVMEKRAHADRCYSLPDELVLPPLPGETDPTEVDLMIEAKDKEQAVFLLHRMYDLAPVKHENLRPEKPQKLPTADVAEEGGVDDEANPEAIASRKRPRRTRSRKNVEEEVAGGSTEPYPAVSSPRKKRSPRKNAETCMVTNTPSSVQTGKESVTSLINQEENPASVEDTDVEAVEAEEHPE